MRKSMMIVLLVLVIGVVIGLGVRSYTNMHDHEACGPDDGCVTLAMTGHDHVSR